MPNESEPPMPPQNAPESTPVDEPRIGLQHTHGHEVLSTLAELQHAQRFMHWDTTVIRIVSVEQCRICGEHDRDTVQECAVDDCTEHRICLPRFR